MRNGATEDRRKSEVQSCTIQTMGNHTKERQLKEVLQDFIINGNSGGSHWTRKKIHKAICPICAMASFIQVMVNFSDSCNN